MYFLNNGESCKTHSSDFTVAEDQGGGANLDQKKLLPCVTGQIAGVACYCWSEMCTSSQGCGLCSLNNTVTRQADVLLQSSWLLLSWLRWRELAGIFKFMGIVTSPTHLGT